MCRISFFLFKARIAGFDTALKNLKWQSLVKFWIVQSNMQLWLKAETGTNTTIDGNDVTAWADQSINGYTANADVSSVDDPTYSDNAINFNPGIEFDGDFTSDFSDGLHLGSDYIFSNNDEMNIFAVVAPNTDNEKDNYVFDFGLHAGAGYGLSYSNSNFGSYSSGFQDDINHINGEEPSLLSLNIDFGSRRTQYRNGAFADLQQITIAVGTTCGAMAPVLTK